MLHHDVSPHIQERRTVWTDGGDVVVADDGGCGSHRAREQAGREADLRGVGLVVVTLRTRPFVEPTGYAAWTCAENDAADHASQVNLAAQRRIRDARPGLHVEGVVVSSLDDLVPVAAKAGLLVLGRHGAGGQGVFRLGTTSGDLVKAFPCPVLVCRDERFFPPRTSAPSSRHPEVIAAVHVRPEIPTVLRYAVREATTRGMHLCVLSAGRPQSNSVAEVELAAEKSVPWRLVWTSEDAQGLLRYADPDDLLVLGHQGGDHLTGHVTGSWTRTVLDRMPCDVMLVPR